MKHHLEDCQIHENHIPILCDNNVDICLKGNRQDLFFCIFASYYFKGNQQDLILAHSQVTTSKVSPESGLILLLIGFITGKLCNCFMYICPTNKIVSLILCLTWFITVR